MDSNRIEGDWKQLSGQAKTKWGKPAFQRTRNNKRTEGMIVRRRPANKRR